jgi:hypothetical protein
MLPLQSRQGTYVLHFANCDEVALEKQAGGIEPMLMMILSDINSGLREC